MEIRRTDNRHEFDVFNGKGWDDWTRVHKGRSSTYVKAGHRLSKSELHWLDDVLDPRIPITYGQTVEQMLFNIQFI